MVGAKNGPALAGHLDRSSNERTVVFWNLDSRYRELKCGVLGRNAEKHGNEGSHRLMAKRSLSRQLVPEGIPN